jgi:RNA polymerase sigma-70 factor, ECF subfamily
MGEDEELAAAAVGGDRELAEEAAQDALYRLFTGLSRYRGESSLGTFIFGICRNAAVDALRRRLRDRKRRAPEPKRDLPASGTADAAISPYLGPEESLLRESQAEALRRAMAAIAEDERSLLYLKEVEGLRVAQLASILGVPEGTVKSRLSRARDRLRAALEEDGYALEG